MTSERTPTMLTRRRVLRTIAACALLACAGTRIGFQAPTRRLLAVHFTMLQLQPAIAFGIWRHNLTILAGVAVAMLCAHFIQASESTGRLERLILYACDTALCLWAAGSAGLAGALTGAYGARQLRAFLPQAPVEIAAWLLLILLYVDVRHRRAPLAFMARRLAVIAVLLAAAAILELWAGV
jgi:hypothetical protein